MSLLGITNGSRYILGDSNEMCLLFARQTRLKLPERPEMMLFEHLKIMKATQEKEQKARANKNSSTLIFIQ